MHLTEFRIFEAVGSNAQVVIELGKRETRTALNFIRQATKALQHGVIVEDIEGAANVAFCLMTLAEEAVLKSGWGASVATLRAALRQLRQSACGAARAANDASLKAVNELLGAVDATLLVLGKHNAF
jgi:hypothetical protein